MRQQLLNRLQELRGEFETGQTRLQELERQMVALRETLLRISGAIQVLEEVLEEGQAKPAEAPASPGETGAT